MLFHPNLEGQSLKKSEHLNQNTNMIGWKQGPKRKGHHDHHEGELGISKEGTPKGMLEKLATLEKGRNHSTNGQRERRAITESKQTEKGDSSCLEIVCDLQRSRANTRIWLGVLNLETFLTHT